MNLFEYLTDIITVNYKISLITVNFFNNYIRHLFTMFENITENIFAKTISIEKHFEI
jgi:hypothetical protein